MSSNVNNTGFYNSLGFVTEADILMGDDDPDWHTKPVVIKLVRLVRGAKQLKTMA